MAGLPPGRTNNPNGRPPRNRSLSLILETALEKTFELDGKKISGKRIIAAMVSRAAVTGRVRFPGDTEDSVISVKDWIGLVQWVYERIDGKPKQPISGDGEVPLKVLVEYVNRPYPATSTPPGASSDIPESE